MKSIIKSPGDSLAVAAHHCERASSMVVTWGVCPGLFYCSMLYLIPFLICQHWNVMPTLECESFTVNMCCFLKEVLHSNSTIYSELAMYITFLLHGFQSSLMWEKFGIYRIPVDCNSCTLHTKSYIMLILWNYYKYLIQVEITLKTYMPSNNNNKMTNIQMHPDFWIEIQSPQSCVPIELYFTENLHTGRQ